MEQKVVERKIRVLLLLVVMVFVVLVSRLVYLQVFQSEKYRTLSEQNRVRFISIPAPRGEIRDQKGRVIVRDRPVYVVSIMNNNEENTLRMLDKLSKLLQLTPEEKEKIRQKVLRREIPSYEPVRVKKDVPMDLVTRIEEHREELPGVVIDVEPQREYLYGSMLAHVVGYVREINEEELAKNKDKGYKPGDRFGKAGLERKYEEYLRGEDGARQVEVNVQGRVVKSLGLKSPVQGNSLILTIDIDLQKKAEEIMDRTLLEVQKEFPNAKAGAMVMLDVKTGKILAMVSRPTYDPSIFNREITVEESRALFSNETPFPAFTNRALAGYAPGSTFKMITALAALEAGTVTPSTVINCPGAYRLGTGIFKCWATWGHGAVNLVRALQVSCDVYFYTIGHRTGVNEIARVAKEFGLGQPTGILPEEGITLVPTPEWKRKVNEKPLKEKYEKIYKEIEEKYQSLIAVASNEQEKKQLEKKRDQELARARAEYNEKYRWYVNWQAYETINMSIGQGDNLYSPLQLANYVATIANGGTLYRPYLVEKIVAPNGKTVKEFTPQVIRKVAVKPENLEWVKRGMIKVTEGEGTASSLFVGWPIKVAAKTGTAELGRDPKTGKERDNNGLFVAFAPADDPQVAVAAVVEYGGHGGSSAGVAARDLLAAYFGIEMSNRGVGYSPE
ncbi:MAG: penicillin-binding protein 2 [Eubacteriales bacterium]|nr:penicillin-binding protein 2 [Eubacteriales bacterium]